jgi:nucleoside-diphosphate-sugar epimerase
MVRENYRTLIESAPFVIGRIRMLDVSRAERLFGFRAKTKFEDGLKKTVGWYLANMRTIA